MIPDYQCTRCEWAGGECDRRDHYPVCPDCGAIVDVNGSNYDETGGVPANGF